MKVFSRFQLLLTLAAATALSSAANAQAVIAQREISLGAARDMAVAAVEHCRKGGHRIAVPMVDGGGQPRLFHRDDGAAPHTADASFKKAYTARTYRTPSAEFMKRTEVGGGGRPGLRQINNVLGVPGGLPIKIGEETTGGIGSPGAPGAGGRGCARAPSA